MAICSSHIPRLPDDIEVIREEYAHSRFENEQVFAEF
jgi:hypothetical protein